MMDGSKYYKIFPSILPHPFIAKLPFFLGLNWRKGFHFTKDLQRIEKHSKSNPPPLYFGFKVFVALGDWQFRKECVF